MKKRIETDEGVVAKEQALADAVETWWKKHKKVLADLPETRELMKARASLLGSFEKAVGPVGLLDRFQVAGVVATWWGDSQKRSPHHHSMRFLGLVEAWEASILTALADGKSKDNPLDHRLVKRLLPGYLAEIAELEAKKAEFEAGIKGASGEEGEGEEGGREDPISEEELAGLKKQLGLTKRALKAKQEDFAHKLKEARSALLEPSARDLVLGILRSDLDAILGHYAASHRQEVVAVFIVVRGMILAHSFPVCLAACEMAFNQDVKGIVAREGISGRFLAYWFLANTSRLLAIVTEATHGTKRIDLGDLHRQIIALPSPEEQGAILVTVEAHDARQTAEQIALGKFRLLKAGLMEDLLTGRVRVTNLLQDAP